MPWTTPPTYAAGGRNRAVDMNTYVGNNLSYLASPPFCDVYSTAAFTMSATPGTATAVTFDTEIADSTGAMHSTTVNTSRITVPVDGLYAVEAGASIIAQATATYFRGYIGLNGSATLGTYAFNWVPISSTYNSISQSRFIRATANQYFEFFVLCGIASVALENSSGRRPYLQVRWMGP